MAKTAPAATADAIMTH